MRIPAALFEEEDLREFRKRAGQSFPVLSDGTIKVTNSDIRILERMISEGTTSDRPNNVVLSSTLLRATTTILTLIPKAETVSDVAAVLTASLQVASMDPSLGNRLINTIRLPSKFSSPKK